MSQSPYISQSIKDYLNRHKIEPVLNDMVNSMLKQLPKDPFAFLLNSLSKLASQDLIIVKVQACQHINSEGLPIMVVIVQVQYLQKKYTIRLNHSLSNANQQPVYLLDQDRYSGKGLNKAVNFINQQIALLLKNSNCAHQKNIDTSLKELFSKSGKGLTQITFASLIPFYVRQAILFKPLHKCFFQGIRQQADQKQHKCKFNVIMNVLQGSKIVSSKCKVWRYYIMAKDIQDPYILQAVTLAIKKTITSGKAGQAALKFFSDGTFLCTADTIIDNLKIVEEAINSSGLKDQLSVGLSFQADLFYNPEQKKFQLQNPKQLLDLDQLIQYYFKLCTDKPIITYLQDPVPAQDINAWVKIINKFKQTKIKLGSRKIYSSEKSFKHYVFPLQKANFPQMTQQSIAELNSKRILLFSGQVRPFQKPSLSQVIDFYKLLKSKKVALMLSDNSVQTSDTSIVDLSRSMQFSWLNLGPMLKAQRTSKLYRMYELLKERD